jgi:hypothetical protein
VTAVSATAISVIYCSRVPRRAGVGDLVNFDRVGDDGIGDDPVSDIARAPSEYW